MGIKSIADKILIFIKKYRYAVLILVIGLVLITIPLPSNNQNPTVNIDAVEKIDESGLEAQLATILSQIHGAGEVKVLLSISAGEEIIYQTDTDETSSGDSVKKKNETMITTDASRNETGLVRQRIPPNYLGAIIVCQGAGDPSVRLSIVDAVSKLTGLGASRISVLKMK